MAKQVVVGGQGLLVYDLDAIAKVREVAKANCLHTLELNADRVEHFKRRLSERGLAPSDWVIVLINVDDFYGSTMADALMPGFNWQEIRDRGEIPFARGLAGRKGIEEAIDIIDPEVSAKLRALKDRVAVVVVDHSVAEIFAL